MINNRENQILRIDSLIIGSGIAGLNLARKLAQSGQKVFICSKDAVTEGSSKYAQGGVAVYSPLNHEDSLESHIQDTIKAGKGLCNEEAVSQILSEGWSKVEELIKLGVEFYPSFNIEGSHSYKRVMHVADATGRAIMKPLLDNVSRNHNVFISQGTDCLSLLKSEGKVIGAILETISGEIYEVYAKNTILASGGLSSLYEESTNPKVSSGDGIALAYDAGAKVENLEFIQFHPTAFKTKDGKNFLISEATRGAGALLRNSKKELFANKYDPDAELATRDIVSRAIVQEMKETDSDFVYLDFTQMNSEILDKDFPTIKAKCLENGYDLKKDLLPVHPAAHYTIGGIKTDINGRSNVEGLYAVGECASTGLHGANRLASNSLLECIVVPDFIAKDIVDKEINNPSEENHSSEDIELCSDYIRPSTEELKAISKTISSNLGIERNKRSIKEARVSLEEMTESKERTLGLLIAKSASLREESRGAHFRKDFTQTKKELVKNTILSKASLKATARQAQIHQ